MFTRLILNYQHLRCICEKLLKNDCNIDLFSANNLAYLNIKYFSTRKYTCLVRY